MHYSIILQIHDIHENITINCKIILLCTLAASYLYIIKVLYL
jgi:hypothetical protein